MVTLTNEVLGYMKQFKFMFGEIVPLREIPQTVTTEDLINAIKKSIDAKENLLLEIFNLKEVENNSDIIV